MSIAVIRGGYVTFNNTWSHCYKTLYVRNLRTFQSACYWQASQPRLMFAGQTRAYLSEAPMSCSTSGQAPGLTHKHQTKLERPAGGQTFNQRKLEICKFNMRKLELFKFNQHKLELCKSYLLIMKTRQLPTYKVLQHIPLPIRIQFERKQDF